MQQDKNIENKLQQLENQQLPDLSRMDAHWQQMQAMLQSADKGTNGKRWIWYLVAACFIGAAVFVFNTLNKNTITPAVAAIKNKAVEKQTAEKKQPVLSFDSNLIKNSSFLWRTATSIKHANTFFSATYSTANAVYMDTFNLRFFDCDGCPDTSKKLATAQLSNNARQVMLRGLLAQLAKEAQEFAIDNRRDTLIHCTEGTGLLIPANSLGGNAGVIFSIKEFYKESDIVLNQLSTVSNKDQLVTGGMFEMTASVNGKPVDVAPGLPIRLYMQDTSSSEMANMQLFNGRVEEAGLFADLITKSLSMQSSRYAVNWVPQGNYFQRPDVTTFAQVINLVNEPFRTRETKKGTVGFFKLSANSSLSAEELKQELKTRYGYSKVKIRSGKSKFLFWKWRLFGLSDYNGAAGLGDTVWMEAARASQLGLKAIRTSTSRLSGAINLNAVYMPLEQQFTSNSGNRTATNSDSIDYGRKKTDFASLLRSKYSVDVKTLGWINCDRFYNDGGSKIDYVVNLGDTATNYYTMLVFDDIKSMMSGSIRNQSVVFQNVPAGQKVKVISIGIDKQGEMVIAVKPATINRAGLASLEFETTNTEDLKSSLRSIDK